MINILIVDDHAIVREGLSRIINDTDEITITGEASTGEEAIDKIHNQQFDFLQNNFLDKKKLGD